MSHPRVGVTFYLGRDCMASLFSWQGESNGRRRSWIYNYPASLVLEAEASDTLLLSRRQSLCTGELVEQFDDFSVPR
jgi:hypothetical protein